jgi:hypothetical protein
MATNCTALTHWMDVNYVVGHGGASGTVKVRVTLRLAVSRQSVRLGDNPLRLTTSSFIFQLNTYGYSPYERTLLSDERMGRLQ